MVRSIVLGICLCLGLSGTLAAQVLPVGTVDGTVKDPSGALLPGIKVTLAGIDTGQSRDATTNEQGYFFFPLVQPGRYEVSAEKSGFKKGTQQVMVRTAIRSTADFTLELGHVTESVEVTGAAPLLETTTSAVSRNVTQRVVTDMPLLARNVLMLINLAPGITNNSPTGTTSGLIDIDNTSYTSASGANNRQNEFLMDGIPNNVSDRVAYIPTLDNVEEFTVQTNALDAEYGHGGGMFVNVVTKGGTNEFHGSLWEFLRNDKLNANSFFANKAGRKADGSPISPRPVFRFNQFGLTAGGPVIKNKVFWFFNFEGLRQRTPTTYRITVPTALQRTGDFSHSLDAKGNLMLIADPWTTNGSGNRTLFSDNKIPVSRISPVAPKVLALYPAANLAGDSNSGTNNYFTQIPAVYDGENYSARVDPNVKNHRLFVRWSHNQGFPGTPTPWDIGGGIGAQTGNNRAQNSIGISDVVTLNPTTVITGQLGYTRWTQEGNWPIFDQTTLGFPSSLVSQLEQAIFPPIFNSDMYYIGADSSRWYEHTNTVSLNVGLTKIYGAHAMKFGFQEQIKQNNSTSGGRPGGRYVFDRGFTQPNAFTSGTNQGNGIASFLLGTPNGSGNPNLSYLSLRANTATQAPFYGWYFQDDFKVTPKLTLNLGLRYDLLLGTTERYNRNTFGFDPRPTNPISAAARAAYAVNSIPELSLSSFNVNGGLLFASPDNRRNQVADKTNWQPRIGLAYRLFPKTVLRTGFGIFYSEWWQPFGNSVGFTSQTEMLASLDGGLTPANLISNPFPDGFIQPTGASLGLATLLGTPLSIYDYWRKNISNSRWSFGFQHEIMQNLQVEVNYVGQHAAHLAISTSAGDAGRILSGGGGNGTGGTFDQKYYVLGSRLNAKVPNPFYGLIPAASALGASTITVSQLVQPYPQFSSVSIDRDLGDMYGTDHGTSNYHSLQISAMKRMSYGLSAQMAYTFSKQTERMRYIEPSDKQLSNMIGQFDNTHRFSSGIIYELPFGEGKPWRANIAAVDKVIGGWQWSAMYIYQTGAAVALPAAVATGVSPAISNRTIDHWFNGASMKIMPPFTARRIPFYWDNLRVPAINNWDMAFIKNTWVYKERVKLQFRGEMINAFNRVWFGGLSTGPASATYTQLASQANPPRNVQFGLKLLF